jgi:uncharacterized membrane protein
MQHNQPLSEDLPKQLGAWTVLRRGLVRHTHMRSHPRLFAAATATILVYLLLSGRAETPTRLLLAFDCGALVFLAAIWFMMAEATPEKMRRRAEIEDEGRYTVLILSVAVATAILLTIIFQLHGLKDLPSSSAGLHVGLAAITILLSWFFMNTMFALHYAHGYYGDADPSSDYKPVGGLIFPGKTTPDYWDFLYFSFVVGMTFQVSDVQIEDHELRRAVLGHGVLAFFFNVVVLALTINIFAGLI